MPMNKGFYSAAWTSLTILGLYGSPLYAGTSNDQMEQEIKLLKQRIETLETQQEEAKTDEAESVADGIKLGGAVRFQYSNERYSEGNRDRGGDADFDIFRLDLNGTVGDVTLSAQWRWFQYMNAVHHAWVGYGFSDESQVQFGVNKVPFGILPYSSHSFFFSSNYYVGLEDDYDTGVKFLYQDGPWDIRLGFYLNDEMGGVDGYVDNREDRYSYDVVGVRASSEGTYDQPSGELAENNTWNARVAYTLTPVDALKLEFGASAQFGALHDGSDKVGDHDALALHLVGDYGPWNLQLQAAQYEYDVDGDADLMAVGAYSFYDTIPTEANTYVANLAYSLPVAWGPITNLTFYNDYTLVTDKSADLDDTWMDVLGVAVSAGGLYTYIDFVTAENQPFIGGTMGSDSEKTEHRFNINFGYYF